jgi:glycosyltransferase involved in cell wall biosynthesis
MSHRPLVSVIIPCKDGAVWLGEAIESCLDQTWKNLEIIVVDNGSSDDSVQVAKGYGAPAVTVLQCERAGASAARNVGLAHARGDFIQFLDADDVLDRDKIRVQMERLAGGPGASVASGAWTRFRDSPAEAAFTAEPVWADLDPDEFLISSWFGGGMMPSFAWLTPHEVIKKAGLWNERLSLNDDGEYFCRVVLASSGILFCNDARGYYRTGAGRGLSRRRDRNALTSGFEAIELSCSALLKHCSTASARKACATHFQRFIYDAYPDVPDLVDAAERRVMELGGSELQMHGGHVFQIISSSFGWKFGKRCQLLWRKIKALSSGARKFSAHRQGRTACPNGPIA